MRKQKRSKKCWVSVICDNDLDTVDNYFGALLIHSFSTTVWRIEWSSSNRQRNILEREAVSTRRWTRKTSKTSCKLIFKNHFACVRGRFTSENVSEKLISTHISTIWTASLKCPKLNDGVVFVCVVFWQQPLLDAMTLLPFTFIAPRWSSTGPRVKKKADTWVSILSVITWWYGL